MNYINKLNIMNRIRKTIDEIDNTLDEMSIYSKIFLILIVLVIYTSIY